MAIYYLDIYFNSVDVPYLFLNIPFGQTLNNLRLAKLAAQHMIQNVSARKMAFDFTKVWI